MHYIYRLGWTGCYQRVGIVGIIYNCWNLDRTLGSMHIVVWQFELHTFVGFNWRFDLEGMMSIDSIGFDHLKLGLVNYSL